MLAEKWDDCVEIARDQIRDGAHLLDLCVDYVGRDGVADMREVASRFATASTLPIVLDSTEPAVIEAGLELLGGRSVVNSVNYEDGDGPDSRFARVMPIIREHGAAVVALTIDEEGQARTAEWKVRVASRLIDDLTGNWGMHVEDIIVDCLTFPIATGQEETRRDGLETIEAIREVKRRYPTCRPRSACPTCRSASTRPPASCSTPSSCTSASRPASTRRSCTPPRSCRCRGSPRSSARSPSTWSTTGAARATTRCSASSTCSRASTRQRCGSPAPRSSRCCRWPSGWSAGSSTASATASRPTWTRRSTPA